MDLSKLYESMDESKEQHLDKTLDKLLSERKNPQPELDFKKP